MKIMSLQNRNSLFISTILIKICHIPKMLFSRVRILFFWPQNLELVLFGLIKFIIRDKKPSQQVEKQSFSSAVQDLFWKLPCVSVFIIIYKEGQQMLQLKVLICTKYAKCQEKIRSTCLHINLPSSWDRDENSRWKLRRFTDFICSGFFNRKMRRKRGKSGGERWEREIKERWVGRLKKKWSRYIEMCL